MGKPNINIQDGFLFQSLKEDRRLDVFLVTGKTLADVRIQRFDRYAIIFEVAGKDLLIYKHAIAHISDVAGAAPRAFGRPGAGDDAARR